MLFCYINTVFIFYIYSYYLFIYSIILSVVADSQVSPNFNTKGITMISMALLCDAVIGNVQEKSMKTYGASNAEVVLYSYSIGFLYIFIVMLFTGDLFDGIVFFAQVNHNQNVLMMYF